ncbi:hypothetical protein Lade_0869 [Legionella adelaidensis]|uniref:Uncharacterized protein n=1 Tax=Legionella adelaidensis TaxID=45056 RepID=A0A0W0R559_9GAMM|nr:hypothetical protein [Legionella adelaidensis]KTC66211.1 hypothetical protein Lade_0869 [Legionella adelaidensis]
MPRLFSKNSYSVNDIINQRNLMVFGVVAASCALLVYSPLVFFLTAAISLCAFVFNEVRKNENSIENQIRSLF